jgi:hypothetical protein
LAIAAASSFGHLGCNASCDTDPKDNPPQIYAAGTASGDVYETSPSTGGLLQFPGGKQYFLQHHLGFTPAVLTIFFGFDANGDDLAPCAGNSCVVHCVNSELIWIQNDTCADFLLRVVANARSTDQMGTVCPGGVSVSLTGAADASVPPPEASTTPEASPAE